MSEFFIAFWWINFCIFFSNYVLVYAISHLVAKNKKWNAFIHTKVYSLLPLAYAFVATCFWAVTFYHYTPGYIVNTIMSSLPSKLIVTWSLIGLLFWLPYFRKNSHFCLLHSIPLFLLPFLVIAINIFKYGIIEWNDLFNLLRIYLAGLLIYAVAIAILSVARFFILHFIISKHHTLHNKVDHSN
jgi:hypothetical protein